MSVDLLPRGLTGCHALHSQRPLLPNNDAAVLPATCPTADNGGHARALARGTLIRQTEAQETPEQTEALLWRWCERVRARCLAVDVGVGVVGSVARGAEALLAKVPKGALREMGPAGGAWWLCRGNNFVGVCGVRSGLGGVAQDLRI